MGKKVTKEKKYGDVHKYENFAVETWAKVIIFNNWLGVCFIFFVQPACRYHPPPLWPGKLLNFELIWQSFGAVSVYACGFYVAPNSGSCFGQKPAADL